MKHVALAVILIPSLLSGQDSNTRTPPPPQLVVSARSEVKITPDRATIHISVQTRAPNAAAAASENAQRAQRVMSAIRALGIAQEQISTTGYNVSPEYRYEPNREPRIIGYVVTNTVVVEVRRLDLTGPVIDAALGAGANLISGLHFFASNTDLARREALAGAVAKARADAEAMARAAGGTLGTLLEATVGAHYQPPPRPMMMRAQTATAEAADTPISPGEQTLTVDVSTRWRFVGASSP